jgi:hypothetical protein
MENDVEHRWGQRLPVRARVGLRSRGGLQGIGYISDISISGALLVTGMRALPMSLVKIFLPVGPSMKRVSIAGHVVRCTDEGFAVEWSELAPEVLRSLAPTDIATAPLRTVLVNALPSPDPGTRHAVV